MDATQPDERAALVGALVEQVQAIGMASDHIGSSFSALHQLHPTDFRALLLIYRADAAGEPLTARRLADALSLTAGAVTYVVDRLTASGHVQREADPADGRRVLLRFAPHGREVAGAFFGPLGHAHSAAMESYTPDELRTCLRFLRDVNGALGDFDASLRAPRDA